jgi:hypothetical protein
VFTEKFDVLYKFPIFFIISCGNAFDNFSKSIPIYAPESTIYNSNIFFKPPSALTEADLGALYKRASSPKASELLRVFFTSPLIII